MSSKSLFKFDDAALLLKIEKLGGGLKAAARPAAFAAADVFYGEVVVNAGKIRSKKPHGYKGNPKIYQPGNLQRAIYQAYSPEQSVNGKQVYKVSFNKNKAFYGWFKEFGTVKMAATPFIRPAYEARKSDALAAAQDKFFELAKEVLNAA